MNLAIKNKKAVIDPVCGMEVVPNRMAIKANIKGEIYYFCAEACRKEFVNDREKYLNPKPVKKKGWWCRYTERLEKSTSGKSMKCH